MRLIHTKIVDPVGRTETSQKYESCGVCYFCPPDCTSNYLSPPSPPPTTSHQQFPTVLILMICGLGLFFLFSFSYLVLVRYRSILRNSRRMNQSPVLGNDGLNENQAEAVMDHHVWYINTVGLPQSLIDSIPIFNYKRGEKMIEASDHCPVCLSEFQEDESLRLLPKCSHAFHVPCIDTWLRSHKNCPVCRSPVSINNTNTSIANSTNMGSDHSGSIQGPEFETNETADTRAVHENGDESRSGLDKMARVLSKKRAFRVLSNLSDRRVLEVDQELETVRRSVSMDYSPNSVHNKSDAGCSET